VDDCSLNRKLLYRLLHLYGYALDQAEDGLMSINKVKAKIQNSSGQKNQYDVILMDFVMPNVDGPTATKAVRDLGYMGLISGLTGNALDCDVAYFLSCGANEVMAKPFKLSYFQNEKIWCRSSKCGDY
jgi:two-component system sensor histidine kinase/response regulator